MGDWKGFERLAERIVRDLHPDATVTLDDHLLGHFTEKKRQIDVSIRWTDSDHEQLTIVQARDRSRPADVDAVGEFITVVEASGPGWASSPSTSVEAWSTTSTTTPSPLPTCRSGRFLPNATTNGSRSTTPTVWPSASVGRW